MAAVLMMGVVIIVSLALLKQPVQAEIDLDGPDADHDGGDCDVDD
jgi:hypothetical protein